MVDPIVDPQLSTFTITATANVVLVWFWFSIKEPRYVPHWKGAPIDEKIIPKTTDGCGTFFVIACPIEMLFNFGVPSGKLTLCELENNHFLSSVINSIFIHFQ